MLAKLNPSTAIVLAVFIVAWVALAIAGKPIPAWMAMVAALAGKLLLAVLPQLVATKPEGLS